MLLMSISILWSFVLQWLRRIDPSTVVQLACDRVLCSLNVSTAASHNRLLQVLCSVLVVHYTWFLIYIYHRVSLTNTHYIQNCPLTYILTPDTTLDCHIHIDTTNPPHHYSLPSIYMRDGQLLHMVAGQNRQIQLTTSSTLKSSRFGAGSGEYVGKSVDVLSPPLGMDISAWSMLGMDIDSSTSWRLRSVFSPFFLRLL